MVVFCAIKNGKYFPPKRHSWRNIFTYGNDFLNILQYETKDMLNTLIPEIKFQLITLAIPLDGNFI